MEAGELKQIAEWLTEAGVASIEITGPRGSVRVTSAGACADSTAAADNWSVGNITRVTAATVGIFLDAHPLQAAPLTRAGAAVKAGDVVSLIKIGRIYSPLVAPCTGIVARILVEPGARVDFGMGILDIQT